MLYNRTSQEGRKNRAIGLAVELYNIENDINLKNPVYSTDEITIAEDVYRYDFPSIDTYTGGFSDAISISQIASETLALKEVVSIYSANITGGLKVDTITLPTIGDVETSIQQLQQNNVIYNSDEYGLKAVSNWVSQTGINDKNWTEVIYVSVLNLFVAIGGSVIMTSSNGIDWEEAISYPPYGLSEIAWSPKLSLFGVVFTFSPCVATSTDGKNWTEIASVPFTNVIAITWSDTLELFVAISFNGNVMTSSDGTTWTSRGNQLDGTQGQSVIWSKELNLLVAVSQNGTNRVATSSDGITWSTLLVS